MTLPQDAPQGGGPGLGMGRVIGAGLRREPTRAGRVSCILCYTVCDDRTLSPSAGRHAFPLDFLPNAFTLSSLSLNAVFSSGAQ